MGVEPRGAAAAPGIGPAWVSLAREVAGLIPPAEIERLWVFAPLRRDDLEFGTAVVARRVPGERTRVYTARVVRALRGRERGQIRVVIDDVAECPLAVVYDVLKGVQQRMAESEPPVEIPPTLWFGTT
jgi:hypothetical protein